MGASLKVIFGALVATVAFVVGAACMAVSLITSLDTINNVGQAWAQGMAAGVHAVVTDSFVSSEGRMLAATPFMNAEAPKLPEDLKDEGKNWTEPWRTFLVGQGIKQNYTFTTISVVFAGLPTWMYTAQSRTHPGAQDIEWVETFDLSTPSGVGGFRYWRENSTDVPWDALTNYQPEMIYFNVPLRLQLTSAFTSVPATLNAKTNAATDKKAPACFWLPPQHASGLEAVGVHWDAFCACDAKNSTGHVISYTLMSIALDIQLRQLLQNSPRSANGHNFIIDLKGYLIATTFDAPFYTSTSANTWDAPPNQGCSNSYVVYTNAPAKMGCRYHLSSYAYSPLAGISASTYSTSSIAMETVSSGGSDYIVVVRRVSTDVGKLAYNVVIVVPKDDLLGDVNKGTMMAIGIAVGLIIFAVIVAVVFVFWVLGSLEDVTRRMDETAKLEGLDKEEVLEDDDEEGNGNNNMDFDSTEDSSTGTGTADGASSTGPKSVKTDTQYLNLATSTPKSQVLTSGSPTFANSTPQNKNLPPTKKAESNNSGSKNKNNNGEVTVVQHSWISEIAQLEASYVATHNQLVNFTRYVPKSVVKQLMISGGVNRTTMENVSATVSFVDIKSFTTLCEMSDAHQLSILLKAYFERMTRLVMAHGGIIDRFIGDCVMSIFGAPFKVPRHELLGALCALAYQREVSRDPLKQRFINHGFPLAVRVGVASGIGLAGNIGSSVRKAFTIIGDPTNTANALEPYAKDWGVGTIVGEDVARECNDDLVLRLLTRVKLQGRAKPILCYEVMGVMADAKGKRRGSTAEGDDTGSAGSGGSGASGFSGDGSLNSYSSSLVLGNDVDEDSLLPSNINLEKLVKWHKKRTACDEKTVTFANMFSEAARHVLDHEFANALQKLQDLENEPTIALHHKSHKSVSKLKSIIQDAMKDHGSITNKTNLQGLAEQFYVVA